MRRRGVINRNVVHLLLAGSLVVVGVAVLWRNLPKRSSGPSDEALARVRQATDKFSAADSAAIENGPSEIVDAWMTIPHTGDAVSTEVRLALLEFIVSFFEVKALGDPRAYADWVRGQGYTFNTDDLDDATRKEAYPYFHGTEAPEVYDPYDYFVDYWEWDNRKGNRDGVPVRLTTGLPCFLWHLARIDHPATTLIIPDEVLGEDLDWWNGMITTGTTQNWLPPVTKAQIIERDGDVLHSNVKLGVQGEQGDWFSASVRSYYDPVTAQWYLDEYIYHNTYSVKSGLTY